MTCSTSDVAVCCSNAWNQLAAALLLRLEQPRVLDRDDRLVSEGFYQLNLLFREWPNRGTGHHQNADRDTFTQQRDAEHRAGDANIEDLCLIVFRV